MKQFIAVVSHDAGTITKYADFATQAEADAHVAEFGGKVVTDIDDDLAYWDVSGVPTKDTATQMSDISAAIVLEAIFVLEAQETPTRLAEAVLTPEGKAWLADNRAAITLERAKL